MENRLSELKKFNNRNYRKGGDGEGGGGDGEGGGGDGGGDGGLLPDDPEDEYRVLLMEKLENLHRKPVPPPRRPQIPHEQPTPASRVPFANLDDPFDAFEDPIDTLEDKLNRLKHDPRDPEVTTDDQPPPPYISPEDLPNIPQTPILDTFARPLTRMVDDQIIEITPKTQQIEEKNLSDSLQELFPDIDKIEKKRKKSLT